MAADTTTADVAAHDAHDHAHPTEKSYWIVFAVLAVITAVEVAWSYLGLSGLALVLPLILMMVVKFAIVAGHFMHLWFDLKIINGRYFMWTFAAAIVLAVVVYFIVFATFEFQI
ncbi:MAG: cytochrome C oxidase subunit IV family protein [Acidimicrobiales bacterium]